MNPNKGKYPFPKRSLGQNFLVHKGTIQTIIELTCVKPTDIIVELGPGLGALTTELGKRASKVIAIELDQRLIEWLKEEVSLPQNVELIHGDMLKISFEELSRGFGEKIRIVGNLPYNISGPVLFKIIKERKGIKDAIIMLQREVANRLLSPPGKKDYGVLSVILGSVARSKQLLSLPPTLFRPQPKVHSTLVLIDFSKDDSKINNFNFFVNLVKTSFQKRRKKLLNALKGLPNCSNSDVNLALKSCGLTGGERAEELDNKAFICLANTLAKI